MSKYTTELRFICERYSDLNESVGYASVENVISNALPKLFDFNFPIFDENYRTVLETKIVKHYYTREISEETVGLWKLRLNTKLNEIMPYYNKLYNSELLEFNPLYTHEMTRTHKTDIGTDSTTNNTNTGNSTSDSTNYNLYSDTPQGALTGVDNETYLTNATKDIDHSTNNISSNTQGNNKFNSTENYLESVQGREGGNGSELLLKYRETFLNIDMMVINELDVLFFQLW